MQVIRIDQVRPGQVTAAIVQNSAGGTLVSAGTELSAGHIRSLKTAGIASVTIVSDGKSSESNAFSPATRLAGLEDRFQGVTNPVLLQIHDAVAARLTAMMPGTHP